MRERLIGILVVLIVGVVVLYAVPRAYFTADLVRDHETLTVDLTADVLEARIESRVLSGAPIDRDTLESALDGTDGARYVAPDGTAVVAGQLDDDTDSAIVETRRTDDGGTLMVTRDRSVVTAEVENALLPLIVLGVLLASLACAIGYVVAGRMSRPFDRLALAAGELGRGNFELDLPRRGVPEAQAISEALGTAASRLDELVRREREFAVNASHQLRTPITALRLELEDLTYWPETTPEVADQVRRSIGEIDRLTASIDDLLDLARRQRHGDQVDLDLTDFVTDTVQRWQRRVGDEHRDIVVEDSAPVRAVIATGPVAQVVDILIENARQHGIGTITVATREVGDGVEVRVRDEGRRSFGSEILRQNAGPGNGSGAGVGLAVATELTEAAGGRLSLDEASATTCFVLLLPAGR
ncbi:histidine kinase dimerization/phospho-acceptor domain-containing protein [Aeromicrobium sp. Sec7.5]|uniref:histidine kinase dimerization/phospho-acceptor domain-containing protein n=1 Tax=Aeromicrobium sp. Sec7.5 TaxID=3121276 RepID=UPI002FE4D949